MTAVSSVYTQRLLITLFLVSFGIYLFLATVTYTPFDPGWMHISSDMQKVSNASGVTGAWIADLLYGFLGWASLLLPIFLFIEAIQVWWPRSFLNRPFRYAAQFFILLSSASLFYLFLNEPNDTLENASGGIIGFEVGGSLANLLTMYGAGLFLIVLWFVLFTLAFGIQWNKTWATIKAVPKYLQDLFYKNVPESEAAYDLTTQQKAKPTLENLEQDRTEPSVSEESVQKKKNITEKKAVPVVDDVVAERLFNDFAEQVQDTPVVQSAPVKPKAPEPEKIQAPIIDDATFEKTLEKAQQLKQETQGSWRRTVVVEDRLDRQEQEIHDLLKAAQDESGKTQQGKQVEPIDWDDDQIFDELLEVVPKQTAQPQKVEKASEVERDTQIVEEPVIEQKVVATHIQSQTVPLKPVETQESAQPLSKEQFLEAWQETAGQPQDDDLDAPLTDTHGRPMSRAMQVVEKRRHLSPLPSEALLDKVDPDKKVHFTQDQLARLSELLEIKLQEFNVKAQVVDAQPGPVVTRFELDLAPGVKASKVTNISKDLARSMSMASVRVVEVIPGKPYIGIEVPNSSREMVRLIELLDTPTYRDPSGLISMAMGKDISGNPVLADLAKAPHMLVAGTTGSGKSVAVNAMLLSMLLKYDPKDLRLILIDPKQLELANYSDIPHLLTPVVTDMKDAVSALNWCVNEMERRYKLMAVLKVRKIVDYNRKVEEAIANGEDLLDPTWKPSDSATQERAPRLQPLPMIVIVADEFADMIMQVGKKAEEMITRLAQKSRAAGIHLLLATQRPSVDVITGLIKANIPTRVALRVNSKIDSRTILDAGGAEDLLGHGDMLFLGPGKIEPERVHGAFISDDEVNRICDAWRERGEPNYVDEILTPYDEEPSSSRAGGDDGEGNPDRDVLYDQAVAFVLETRKASASSLQRKFSLGYNRAARLIDTMEEQGVISAMGSNGRREILV